MKRQIIISLTAALIALAASQSVQAQHGHHGHHGRHGGGHVARHAIQHLGHHAGHHRASHGGHHRAHHGVHYNYRVATVGYGNTYVPIVPSSPTVAVVAPPVPITGYPLGARFHKLVMTHKLPAQVVWQNGQYLILYNGQWIPYTSFVQTYVDGNWDWYHSRYRTKYAAVLALCPH